MVNAIPLSQEKSTEPDKILPRLQELSEPEPTMPDWITPDPEARDRGKLLYVEEWGQERKYHDHESFFYIGMSLFFLIICVISIVQASSLKEFVGISLLIIYLGLVFIFSLQDELGRLPLMIWENGFSAPNLNFDHSFKREEEYIPWEKIENIEVRHWKTSETKAWEIVFHPLDGKEYSLRSKDVKDPLKVMQLLNLCVPEKINDSFRFFIGKKDEQRSIVRQGVDFNDMIKIISIIILFFGFFAVGLIFGETVAEGGSRTEFATVVIAIIGFIVMFDAFLNMIAISEFEQSMENFSKIHENGIRLQSTWFSSFFYTVRKTIPWEEIRAVRMKLNSLYYNRMGEIETYSGKKWRVPYFIYNLMKDVEGYHVVADTLGNEVYVRTERMKGIDVAKTKDLEFSNAEQLIRPKATGFVICVVLATLFTFAGYIVGSV